MAKRSRLLKPLHIYCGYLFFCKSTGPVALRGYTHTTVTKIRSDTFVAEEKLRDPERFLLELPIMQLTFIFFLICAPGEISSTDKTKRKSHKTTTEATETTTSQPAIIAIEIVDPNENSTSSKNSKRTIESSLGYGYNSFGSSKPRYEVYKYSQHDIHPYKGSTSQLHQSSSDRRVNIQKSIQYSLPSITQKTASTNNFLQPGTTLYSSLNGKGHVGGLSSTLPQVTNLEESNVPVPVIVLRLYPHQLQDSTIQAKLPKGHPFAKSINSLDIRSLLLEYVKTLKSSGSLSQYSTNQEAPVQNYYSRNQYLPDQGSFRHNTFSTSQVYSTPLRNIEKPAKTNYQTNYYSQNNYQSHPRYQNNNGGAQNYMYFQQSFPQRSNQDYSRHNQYHQESVPNYNSGVTVQAAPVKYEYSIESYEDENNFRYQNDASQKPRVTETSTPQPQYYYVTPVAQKSNTQSTESSQYYVPPQQVDYNGESDKSVPPQQQYYTENESPQYQEYYQANGQQYNSADQDLLTYENYPTPKHTRVVFKTESGNVRTPEPEEATSKEIKTIQIQVPDNIEKVEVQESERPYYDLRPTYENTKEANKEYIKSRYQQAKEYEKAASQNNRYLPSDEVPQEYYKHEASAPINTIYYQNTNNAEMEKYFQRRGALPQYYFQNPKDIQDETESNAAPTENIISVYEKTAFPSSSTSSPEKKKVKSKKRTRV